MRKGYRFVFSEAKTDTYTIPDPVTRQPLLRLATTIPQPVKVNDTAIADAPAKRPKYKGNNDDLRAYLLHNMETELGKLYDGEYYLGIRDILVDVNGRIIYFGYEGIRHAKSGKKLPTIMQLEVYNKMLTLLEKEGLYKPASTAGSKVVAYTDDGNLWTKSFKITAHKLEMNDK